MDLIERQVAIDTLCAVCGNDCDKSEFVYNAPQDEQVILCPEHYCLCTLPSVQPEQDREFIKLTVRNSNGRPYYSIIYLELDDNGVGHDFEGYSSYSLDVISDYLKKYFMPSVQPEPERTMEEFMYGQDMGNPEDGGL